MSLEFQEPGDLHVPVSKTHSLTPEATSELELATPLNDAGPSLLNSIMPGCSKLCSKRMQERTARFYSDRRYLQDTQAFIKNYNAKEEIDYHVADMWTELYEGYSSDKTFHTRFQYIDLDRVMWVNHNPFACQMLVTANYTAPVLNLLLPFFSVLIILILQFVRTGHVTVKDLGSTIWNTVGKRLLGALTAPTLSGKMYAMLVALMYVLNVYANVRSCIKFQGSFAEIEEFLDVCRRTVQSATTAAQTAIDAAGALKTYAPFKNHLTAGKTRLSACTALLRTTATEWFKGKRGYQFHTFYQLLQHEVTKTTCKWAANLLAYCEAIHYLHRGIASKALATCSFSKTKTAFSNMRHPYIPTNTAVLNSVSVEKSIVLTGPNASGKTTTVKAIMINTLLCQQYGCGAFKRGKVCPVVGMHCYMNVPDSAERDSLFQAEARRCKHILDTIETNPGPHLCLFDELYSGTNPIEAAGATVAYLSYMDKSHPDTKFLLTTHLTSVCEPLSSSTSLMKMGGILDSKGFAPSYRCDAGVSRTRSGYLVLRDLGYPPEITASLNTFTATDN